MEAITMANTISRRIKNPLRLLAALGLLGLQSQVSTLSAQTYDLKQRFVCNTGYTLQECQAATAVLRKALAQYPMDALGKWTWVLVRTEDWKRILSARGVNTNVPAFSNLTKRVTLLDGSLVVETSARGVELRMIWQIPIEDLLDLSIRHELAHAFCNERNELEADRVAIALKDGAPFSCRGTLVAKSHTGETRTTSVVGFNRRETRGVLPER
jgi:hypothetical protein